MIRIGENRSETLLSASRIPAKLFVFRALEPVRRRTVYEDYRILGHAVYYTKEDTVLLYTEFLPFVEEELMKHAIACLANEVIRLYHPGTVFTYTYDERMKHVLPVNLFYPKGMIFQRVVEEWRYRIPDACFDQEGYLINQGLMKELPFGWFSTREKGCGWIAAYNFLKLTGHEEGMQETAESLSRYGFFGELFGENFFRLAHFLRRKGYDIHTAYGKGPVKRAIKASRYGILLYSRGFGAHYTAYRVRRDGRCYFYNALYGRRFHHEDAEEFFKAYGKGFNTMVITVR
ncbi:MAG: hypothetical protein J6S26_04000 [Solobacterium sp.]|nr:hypothetical protein [Solobacterium sp.]